MFKKTLLLFSIIALAIFVGNSKSSPELSTTKPERAINGNEQRQQAKFNNLPPQLQTLIKNTFTLDSYRIFENKTGEIVAANRAQNLKASFSQDKTQIVGTRSSNSWELNLNLTGFGWQNEIKPVEPGVLSYQENRVEIKRPSLTEWFVNETRGLEQGFTINAPPSGQGTQLVLQISVDSNLQSQISENKKDINLSNKTGQSIDYSGLIAKDAQGKELNTWFESKETPAGTTWQIFVDVKDALFPIIVDPFINEDQEILPADVLSEDAFGCAVDLSGDTIIAGAPTNNNPFTGTKPGAAYIFVRDANGIWTQQAKLFASNATIGDQFGRSVALEGDTAVVGALFGTNSFPAPSHQGFIPGSVYVFVRDAAGIWSQQAKLTTPGLPPFNVGCLFGCAIFGDTVLAYNFGASVAGSFQVGAVIVFVRNGTTWSQQAILTPSDAADNDFFGTDIDIFGDTAVIGSPADDDNGNLSGSAYIFVRNAGVWTQQAKLLASDGADDDSFGSSVSIFGETVLVGAPFNFLATGPSPSGVAYTFNRSGTVWTEQLKLSPDLVAASVVGAGTSASLSGERAFIGGRFTSPSLLFNLFCQKDLGFQGPGDLTFCVCGEDLTQDGSKATITIAGAPPSSPIFIVLGFNNTPTPFAGGTIVPSQDVILGPFTTDAEGVFKLPLTGGANTPITLFLQAGGFDGPVFEISNAVEVKIGF